MAEDPRCGDLRITRSRIRPDRFELHMADFIPATGRIGWVYADEFASVEAATAAAIEEDPEAGLRIDI